MGGISASNCGGQQNFVQPESRYTYAIRFGEIHTQTHCVRLWYDKFECIYYNYIYSMKYEVWSTNNGVQSAGFTIFRLLAHCLQCLRCLLWLLWRAKLKCMRELQLAFQCADCRIISYYIPFYSGVLLSRTLIYACGDHLSGCHKYRFLAIVCITYIYIWPSLYTFWKSTNAPRSWISWRKQTNRIKKRNQSHKHTM